jgi:hypothetical protein
LDAGYRVPGLRNASIGHATILRRHYLCCHGASALSWVGQYVLPLEEWLAAVAYLLLAWLMEDAQLFAELPYAAA